MTLQKTIDNLSRENDLVVVSPATISIKSLVVPGADYTQIGPTMNGFHVEFQSDVEYFGDDGSTGPIGGVTYNETGILRFSLSQAGLFNLVAVLNYNYDDHIDITQPVVNPPQDGTVVMKVGGKRDVDSYSVKAQIRMASGKKIREYIFFKAVPEPDFLQSYTDSDRTVFEARFKLLQDISQPEEKRYFSVTDYFDSDYGSITAPNY
ncbi:MAG: hypothetical protein ABIG42_09735 [bacterium]